MSNAMIGSTGGKGGHEFSDYLVPPGARIKEVHISAGVFVDALQVSYAEAGALQTLARIGGSGGRHHTFVLEDDEYITGISGRSGNYVDSLRIHTNKRTSDAFGGHGGEREFQFVVPSGSEVAGFFGRAAWYVDALGIYTRELAAAAAAAPVADAAPVEVAAPSGKGRTKRVAGVPAEEAAPPTTSAAKSRKAQGKLAADVPATAAAAAAVAATAGKRRTKLAAEAPAESPADVAPAPVAAGGKRKPKLPAEVPAEATSPAVASDAKPPRAARKTRAAEVVPLDASAVVERTPRADDLEKVEGIGPAIARLLIQNGIYDLGDLAVTPVARLAEILQAGGARFRIADPATWPEQAGYGARGDWDGMYAFQAELKGGRTV